MEKHGTQLQMLPQVHLHVDTVTWVDIKDGQMKGINEKKLPYFIFFPITAHNSKEFLYFCKCYLPMRVVMSFEEDGAAG
jgi:hypothetical protein